MGKYKVLILFIFIFSISNINTTLGYDANVKRAYNNILITYNQDIKILKKLDKVLVKYIGKTKNKQIIDLYNINRYKIKEIEGLKTKNNTNHKQIEEKISTISAQNTYIPPKTTNIDIINSIKLRDKNILNKQDIELDQILNEIKSETLKVVNGKISRDDKIRVIFDYIVEKLDYDYNASYGLSSYTGIYRYKNGLARCDGYIELFMLMLSYAGIDDIEKIDGRANNGFITDSHSWIRIGDKYYDPTWTDSSNGVLDYFAINLETIMISRNIGKIAPTTAEVFDRGINASKNINNINSLLDPYRNISKLGINNYTESIEKLNSNYMAKILGVSDMSGYITYYTLPRDDEYTFFMTILRDHDISNWKIGYRGSNIHLIINN